ncbi:PQQ-binding-like beta-propeller repeat protein, partial [Streptomyces sp. MUM 203J]|uniref:outer membrane protein assembly factor BamB family protein n=1 Tax=Streptomyces sp. MUM 203J TaxID=2791990 RepID=UPI001F044609
QPPAPGHPQAPGQPPAAPAPGYGYPGAPAQQPGPYGHPGAQHGQPGQPNPYAQHGEQPNPYSQQPGPYGGYPTQPQYPGAPVPPPPGQPGTGSGGKNVFKGRTGIVIAAATAGLLAVGGVTYWAVSGGDDEGKPVAEPTSSTSESTQDSGTSDEVDKGDGSGGGDRAGNDDINAGVQPGEAKVQWLVKNDVDLPRNGSTVHGPWVVGDTVVKAMYRSVEGFSVADGKKKWSVAFDTDICDTTPAPSANGDLVLTVKDGTGERAKCDVLQHVDAKTGKKGWKREIPKAGLFGNIWDVTLATADNTVTVTNGNRIFGFSLADGKELWGAPDGNCKPKAFAGAGKRLLAAANCRVEDLDNPQHELWGVDPATGKAKWKYRIKRGWEVSKVYSVDPLVINIINEKEKSRAILALKDDGSLRSQLSSDKEKEGFQTKCGGRLFSRDSLQNCTGVVAAGDTFYMATEPESTSLDATNELVAFDLNSGKPKWRSPAGDGKRLTPVQMEGGDVLVYIEPGYQQGGAVAKVSASGGAPKVLLQHPASVAAVEKSFFTPKFAYTGGRFVIVDGSVRGMRNDKEELETKTMIAYGK